MSGLRCSVCGSDLPEGRTEQICPRCLLELALPKPGSDSQELTTEIYDQAGSTLPRQIGPYKILEVLGEGGMGIVYLAEQSQPIRRRVALKVIKLGMDTKQVIARFESERQALALMNHPNIAKVLDAGSTENGRPYFAMEYVAGIPITEYCDRHRLHTRDRLQLFTQACDAFQHAHQKGIIHRDIKPSNVLVEIQDDRPVPKVIDFGVVKAINQRLTEQTLFTQHGMLIGTPAYMSPEQAEMSTLDIDTRTDIYSLGVLLYELLVGVPPFEAQALRKAGYDEMRRIIREEDPPTLSSRLTDLGETASKVAKYRHTDPSSLARQLRGDLDWITLKALDKDRTRRYPSASELAADVTRHLADEPVSASPPNRAYVLKKFVRKNRGPVVAVTAVLVSLISGIGFSTYSLHEARLEAQRIALTMRAYAAAFQRDQELYVELSLQSLQMHRQALGPDDPELLAHLHMALMFSEAVVDFWAKAEDSEVIRPWREAWIREGYTLMNGAAARNDPRLITFASVAALFVEQTRQEVEPDLVEPILLWLVTSGRAALPESLVRQSSNSLSPSLHKRGQKIMSDGDLRSAEAILREAIHVERTSRTSRLEPEIAADLARCLVSLGEVTAAERVLIESLEFQRKGFGINHSMTAGARRHLIAFWGEQGGQRRAEDHTAIRQESSALANAAMPGTVFEVHITVGEEAVVPARVWGAQGAGRIDFEPRVGPSSMIANRRAGGSQLLVVSHEQKEYAELPWSLEGLSLGLRLTGGEFPEEETTESGPLRFIPAGRSDDLGSWNATEVHVESDGLGAEVVVWFSEEVEVDLAGFVEMFSTGLDGLPIWFMGLDVEITRPVAMLFESVQRQLGSINMPPGFPVRIIVTSGAGVRTEFALQTIEQRLIDASEFDPPDGYSERGTKP